MFFSRGLISQDLIYLLMTSHLTQASMTSVPVYNAVAGVLWLEQVPPLRQTLAPSPSQRHSVTCIMTTTRTIWVLLEGIVSFPSIEMEKPKVHLPLSQNSPLFIGRELAKTFSSYRHLTPHLLHRHCRHHKHRATQFFLRQRPRLQLRLKLLLTQLHHHFSAIHSKIVFLMSQCPR